MADPIIGNRIIVEIEQSKGNTSTISSITQADPPVVTYTPGSDGPVTEGQAVVFSITSGMDEMHRQITRALNVTGTTFECEGLDATDYEAFIAGTFQVVDTFIALDKARTMSAPNAEPPEVDVTTLKDKRQKIKYGLPGAVKGDMTLLFNPGGTAEGVLRDASDHQRPLAIRVTYADGQKTLMNATVAFGSGFTLAPNQAAESQAKFTPEGAEGMLHFAS